MRILVMGGTRFMGRLTVSELADAGHELVVFNRGNHPVAWPFPVTEVRGDRNDHADLAQLGRQQVDLAIDFSAYHGQHTRDLLDALPARVHVIHCSSGAVYEPVPELPWNEDTPYGPWPIWGAYGAGKVACERVLLADTAAGARIALRLPYVLGPLNYADREEFILNRLLDDAVVVVPGDGEAVIQCISARQVAIGVRRIVEQLRAGEAQPVPRAHNLASPDCLTTLNGLVAICARVAGRTPEVVHAPHADAASMSPLDPDATIFPFPNRSYILDVSRARQAGILPDPESLEEMLASSLAALMASPERRDWRRTAGERAFLGTA